MSAAPQARPRDPPPHSDRKYTVSIQPTCTLIPCLRSGRQPGGTHGATPSPPLQKTHKKEKKKQKKVAFCKPKSQVQLPICRRACDGPP